MFPDLSDKDIQPQKIDVTNLPEIEFSEGLRKEIQFLLEEEEGFARFYSKTAVVQTDKNYVFFSNHWLYLAVLCKKYAEALKPYGDFFDKRIRGNQVLLDAFSAKNCDSAILVGLLPDLTDRERMVKYIMADPEFRPGKSLLNGDKVRSIKDIFGSCVLKKISVPDASSNYLGNLIYYLAKNPDLFNAVELEVRNQIENMEYLYKNDFKLGQLPDIFRTDFSRRYITSLLAKPFVILTGNSGTGKTRVARQFAEYLEKETGEGNKNWLLVPVGADWTDNAKILGFYNPLADNGKGKYEKTGIIRLIEQANIYKNIPFFIILDEMNLSYVERYFSDFLSHMEIPDSLFELDGYEGTLLFPDNVFVVGTVNIDETTYMFSPKVLDRSNVVEFKPEREDVLALFNVPVCSGKVRPANDGTAEAFLKLAKEIRNGKCNIDNDGSEEAEQGYGRSMDDVKAIFGQIYEIVEKQGFEFAYRTVREIRQYIAASYEIADEDFSLIRAIDEQLLQKVLPKIHGNSKQIGKLLDELENICKQSDMNLEQSAKKIEQMKGRLAQVQYASFI